MNAGDKDNSGTQTVPKWLSMMQTKVKRQKSQINVKTYDEGKVHSNVTRVIANSVKLIHFFHLQNIILQNAREVIKNRI